MKNFFRNINSRLARRVGLYVILTSSIISIFTSGFQVYSEFEREKNGVFDTLQQIERTQLSNVASRVWVFDLAELKKTLSNLVELPSIEYVAVYEDGELLAEAGNSRASNLVERQYPLVHFANNIDNQVGNIVIKASLDDAYNNIYNRAFLIVSSNLFKTIIVAFFILYIFYYLVTRHIEDITRFLSNNKELPTGKSLQLNRKRRKEDELDRLVDIINQMQESLARQFSEITNQKQHLYQTLNSIGDAVIVTDVYGYVRSINPVAEKLTGWKAEEATGKRVNAIFNTVTDDGKPSLISIEDIISKEKSGYTRSISILQSKDGNSYHIADSAAPIKKEDGSVLGMVLVFNDITEQYALRKQAELNEKKYRTLITVAPVGVFYTDVNGKCLYVNETWSEITGLTDEQARGDGWSEALHIDDRQTVFDEWQKTASQGSLFKMEYRFVNKGEVRWVLGQAMAEKDETGNIIGFVGTVTDITERKNVEYALSQSQKMEALGKLTGGIAHDYNNMLGVIMGYTELLKDNMGNADNMRNYLDEIYSAANRGAKLTSKLLSFSRHKKVAQEVVNINDVLEAEQHMLEKTLTARIQLHFDLAKNLCRCRLDASDLENAIMNLCINAMHAMEQGGHLYISTQTVQADDVAVLQNRANHKKTYAVLKIRDTGCGIPEEIQQKIFDPFFTTKGQGGTGLGLSQVYGFVERSAGVIQLESALAEGSEFALYFPCCEPVDTTSPGNEQAPSTNRYGTEVVLVVDDEQNLLDMNRTLLSSYGYQVFCANSGQQALAILQEQKVDIVLSDIIMPEMDGFELARQVQQVYPHIKIQLVSGYTEIKHNECPDHELESRLMHKPYSADELLGRLRSLLDNENVAQ